MAKASGRPVTHARSGRNRTSSEIAPGRRPQEDLEEPEARVALRVNETAMEPTFRKGEVIILEIGREARNGDVVVVRWADGTNGLRTYRRWRNGTYDLVPENSQEFQKVTVNANNSAEIVGVVVEHHRKMKLSHASPG
jgi:SOS-response transcriptional repressor LexA